MQTSFCEVPDAFEMSMGITFPTSNNVPMNQRTKFRCKITALGVANVPVFSRTYEHYCRGRTPVILIDPLE